MDTRLAISMSHLFPFLRRRLPVEDTHALSRSQPQVPAQGPQLAQLHAGRVSVVGKLNNGATLRFLGYLTTAPLLTIIEGQSVVSN